jgi:hypothetical protein
MRSCSHTTTASKRPSKALKKESLTLSFSKEDEVGISMPYNDALVVTLMVANHGIHRILVNNESLANILYWPIFKQINIDWERIKPFRSSLVGFSREKVQPMRLISIPVTAGTVPKQATAMVDFLVVDRPFAYNAIMGCLSLNKLKADTSTYHLKMKFLN